MRQRTIIRPEIRFERLTKRGPNCWIWMGPVSRYGRFRLSQPRRSISAHRYAWELAFGPIPGGLCVCHRCDNPICVRPDHLFLATNQENTADKVQKKRQATGERINSKLKPEQVIEMRKLRRVGASLKELAAKFDVTDSCVSFVINYQSWKHLP